jgi:hypothetical protein
LETNRFSLPRTPRITAGIRAVSPAKTIAYSDTAWGNSTAISGTELTVLLNP